MTFTKMFSGKVLPAALSLAAIQAVDAAMGPAFSTGPVAENSWIREAEATLILPEKPSGSSGDASLWVGMGTDNGDLIQSIAEAYESEDWTVFAYTLMSTSENTQEVVQDDPKPAAAGDRVTFNYKYDDDSGNYTQTVSLNGETVSTLSTSDGHAQGFGSSVECAAEDCGTMHAHSWEDVTITLDVADPDYINTFGKGEGVSGELTTDDDGKTWTGAKFEIPEYTF